MTEAQVQTATSCHVLSECQNPPPCAHLWAHLAPSARCNLDPIKKNHPKGWYIHDVTARTGVASLRKRAPLWRALVCPRLCLWTRAHLLPEKENLSCSTRWLKWKKGGGGNRQRDDRWANNVSGNESAGECRYTYLFHLVISAHDQSILSSLCPTVHPEALKIWEKKNNSSHRTADVRQIFCKILPSCAHNANVNMKKGRRGDAWGGSSSVPVVSGRKLNW